VCHEIPDTKFYIVVPETNTRFEQSCRAAGAGLLLLSEDNEFEHVLSFDDIVPAVKDEAFAKEIKELRGDLMSKLELKLGELRNRFERIGELTADMNEEVASRYRRRVERRHRQWSEWGDDIGIELDRVLGERDVASLGDLRKVIELGPLLDGDV